MFQTWEEPGVIKNLIIIIIFSLSCVSTNSVAFIES